MKRKLILNHLLVLLVFTAFTYTFVLKTVYKMVCDNLITVSEQTVNSYVEDLNSIMGFGPAYILQLCTDSQVQHALRSQAVTSSYADISHETAAAVEDDFWRDFMYTKSITINNIPFMLEVTYRTDRGSYIPVYYSSRQNQKKTMVYEKDDEWIQALEARNGKFLWDYHDNSSNTYLRLSKAVYDMNDYSRIIGTISLDFSYDHLALYILNQLNEQAGINAAIVDSATGRCIGYRSVPLPNDRSFLKENTGFLLPGKTRYFFNRRLGTTGFCLVGIKSLQEANRIYRNSCITLFGAAAAALFLGVIMAGFLGRRISTPISRLSHTMKEVKNGNLDISVTTKEGDEIGELYDSFNYMIRMINQLIEENYVTRLNQKQSELDALQSQINTHFLYNTLDSINWLAMDYHAADISYLVTNLSSLLRISLNNGKPELTVEQELNHGRSYLNIQLVRFSGLFKVEEDIDPEVCQDIVIKMLFQPLIENAILHSFNLPDNDSEENLLILRAKAQEDYLLLEVCNNANPEDLDRINEIFQEDDVQQPKSYGIVSIKRRLDIAYSKKARYSYSMDGAGMLCASIRIPRRFTSPDRTVVSVHSISEF